MYTTTYTNGTTFMVQNYNLDAPLSVLVKGGLILLPTDTLWSVGCSPAHPQAIDRLLNLQKRFEAPSIEILVDSITMLKKYVQQIHPRLETLLVYHVRPLTIVFDQPKNLPPHLLNHDGSIYVRVVQDAYCRNLIQALGQPLVTTFAGAQDQPQPSHFGAISSDVIQGVDYVAKYRQGEKRVGEPSVMVRLTDQDELVFLRE